MVRVSMVALRRFGYSICLFFIVFVLHSAVSQAMEHIPSSKTIVRPVSDRFVNTNHRLSAAGENSLRHGYLPYQVLNPGTSSGDLIAGETASNVQLKSSQIKTSSAERSATLLVNRPGLSAKNDTPPNISIAVGSDSYMQVVNSEAAIFSKSNGTLRSSGSLSILAGAKDTSTNFHPRVIWDPTTSRYYYVMNTSYSSVNNKLSIGFSKSSSPSNLSSDWCHYQIDFGTRFPDFPQLGDAATFLIVGVNSYDGSSAGVFLGSDLVFVDKPTTSTTIKKCPSSIVAGRKEALVDGTGSQIFAPVPADQIDTIQKGYVVARNGELPSTSIWVFEITRTKKGWATSVRDVRRSWGMFEYDTPPTAEQPIIAQTLDTLDARMTQAVMAYSPTARRNVLWTVHAVRYFESALHVMAIAPEIVPIDESTPKLLTRLLIHDSLSSSIFNGAISSDRRIDGSQKMYGDGIVITAVKSGKNLSPTMVVGSTKITSGDANSVGLYDSFIRLDVAKSGVGPYRDATCPAPGDVCAWGTTAGAVPDPRPSNRSFGTVWLSNQYSGIKNPSTTSINWATQIVAVTP